MPDELDDRALVIVRRLDAKVDELSHDVRDIKLRLTTLEIAVADLAATEASHFANLALRVDRVEERMARIEKRLDLVEPA